MKMQVFSCYPVHHQLSRMMLVVALLAACGCPSSREANAKGAAPALAAPWFAGFWTEKIPPQPALEPDFEAMVRAAFAAHAGRAVFANDDKWGIAYVEAQPGARIHEIRCLKWCSAQAEEIRFRVPQNARPNSGDDQHLSVIDGAAVLDMYNAIYDGSSDTWSAYSRFVHSSGGNGVTCRGERCLGATASGFALLAGAVRPEEIAAGRINHALALTTPHTRRGMTACPATHTDGRSDSPDSIPLGAHVQLDPGFPVGEQPWPAWKKTIARALQEYGAYVVDTGGSLSIRGVGDHNAGNLKWTAVGVPKGWREGATLIDLPWSRMRVLRIRTCEQAHTGHA